jgi:hypothetical protein
MSNDVPQFAYDEPFPPLFGGQIEEDTRQW